MTAPVVLVTSRSFSSGSVDLVKQLGDGGADVVRGAADHAMRALRDDLGRAVAWIAGTAPITAEHFQAAPHLKLIARYGVGVDSVDLRAAAEHGVIVTNTPGANSDAVAEHALALLLSLLRQVVAGDRNVRAARWEVQRTREFASLRVGIAGYGRIGRALSTRLSALGIDVLAYDPMLTNDEVRSIGARPSTLIQLARECDAVSLHAPGERQLIGNAWLREARPGMLLINTARAILVDEYAVARELHTGQLGGYASDDLGPNEDGSTHPLLADHLKDRVILTPHCAAQTVEAVDNMGTGATAAVLAVLSGGTPPNIVRPNAESRPLPIPASSNNKEVIS